MHRKFLWTLAAALLMASLMSVPAWAETALVTASDVNLREGPGTNYRILDCLPWGSSVTVTDRSDETWYEVDYDGQRGFMSSQYLVIEGEKPEEQAAPEAAPEETPAETETGDPAYVNAMFVRFRSGPGSEYSVLGELNRGKTLIVYDVTGAWASCSIDGRKGYIYADYLSFGVPEGAAQPTPTPTPTQAPAPAQEEEEDDGIPAWVKEQEDKPASTPTPTQAPAAQTAAPTAQTAAPAAQTIGEGYIKGNYVRFRTGPGSNYQIIDAYDYGQALEIVGEADGWIGCLIDGQFGYVHGAYVEVTSTHAPAAPQPTGSSYAEPSTAPAPTPTAPPEMVPIAAESKEGYVSGNNVRMRDGASMSAGIITELFYGNRVTITGTVGDWTAVSYEGKPGYIYSSFVQEGSLSIEGSSVTGSAYAVPGSSASDKLSTELTGSSYEKGQQIAQYALQFVGYNYSWGGKDPSTGFDCSGLVYYVYSQFGYTLNRVAQDQALNGVAVNINDLQPGDILCFYSGTSYIGHVGIYIGDGKFVHAQNSVTGVVITDLGGHYGERGFEARRIVS